MRLDDVALEWPPSAAPPVLVGAIGPRTLRLSGEAADGTVLAAGNGPEDVRRARELIAEGQAAAGRVGGHRLVVYLNVADHDAGQTAAAVSRAGGGRRRYGRSPAAPGRRGLTSERFVRFASEQVRPLLP